MTTRPTLTVFCEAGLANRLRVLISGMAVAGITGRSFRMFWPKTVNCKAAFTDLFTNDWPVIDIEELDESLQAYTIRNKQPDTLQHFIKDQRQDIIIGTCNWIVDCRAGKEPEIYKHCGRLLRELQPIPCLQERIAEIRKQFRPIMIGVHLRRGDYIRERPDVAWNTHKAIAAVKYFLGTSPGAGIILCTDDGARDQLTGQLRHDNVQAEFKECFGDRLIATSPRSLDRQRMESVQDAVVDLWLLRSARLVVGTVDSSFSYLAVLDRDVEYVPVGGKSPAYLVIHWLTLLTGINWLVRYIYRYRHGRKRPFLVAWNDLVRTLNKTTGKKQS